MEFGLLYDFRNPPEWRIPAAELYAETSLLSFATFAGMWPSATIPFFETLAKHVMPAFA